MKSVMKHDFSVAPSVGTPRSRFDRSCGYKSAFDAGYLIPFFIDDVLPGDTFSLNATGFARLSTPEFPILDNMTMSTQFFFVPLRLVWSNAKRFFGEQDNPTDSIDYTIPQFAAYSATEMSLSDYMGLPINKTMTPNSIYHRGYNLIWNTWYRDQNIQDSLVVDLDDGPDDIADYTLQRRGKRHDYFTSCLPWPQKGDAISLPLGTTAPVSGLGLGLKVFASGGSPRYETPNVDTTYTYEHAVSSGALYVEGNAAGGYPQIFADLSNATAATVNDLREAFQIQKLLERDARGGTRYSETVFNHFGVRFYDVSVRPEFLGGGNSPINVTPIAATNGSNYTGGTVNIGDLGAMGTGSFSGHGFTKSFVEHGFIMGMVSVNADLNYQQGIPRHFLKQTRYDIYWPSLAFLGEQEVTNAEIYYQNTGDDDLVFGYNERYAEYRYKNSQITSMFRSTSSAPLDAWHLAQEFTSLPSLSPTFIVENPPLDRCVNVPAEPHFIFDCYTQLHCARPMPMYAVPGMIDHF